MDTNATAIELEQAKMILKALKDGWTVSMTDKEELEFTKEKSKMSQSEQIEVKSEGFSSKFLHSLMGASSKKKVKD
jgi:hypothetical protein